MGSQGFPVMWTSRWPPSFLTVWVRTCSQANRMNWKYMGAKRGHGILRDSRGFVRWKHWKRTCRNTLFAEQRSNGPWFTCGSREFQPLFCVRVNTQGEICWCILIVLWAFSDSGGVIAMRIESDIFTSTAPRSHSHQREQIDGMQI